MTKSWLGRHAALRDHIDVGYFVHSSSARGDLIYLFAYCVYALLNHLILILNLLILNLLII